MNPTKQSSHLVGLDFMRGLLALLVAANHLRACTLIDYGEIKNPNLFHSLFYFFTSLGHDSVMSFFVLSGFFVGGSVLKKGERFNFGEYMIFRLSRLWVPLIPCLLMTAIISLLIGHWFPEVLSEKKYVTLWHCGSTYDYSHSLVTFLGNIFFLQQIWVPSFGFNFALWSLSREFWFYCIFPFIFMAMGGRGQKDSPLKRVVIWLILGLMFSFISFNWTLGFTVWLMGVAAFWVEQKISPPRNRYLFFVCILAWIVTLFGGKFLNSRKIILDSYDLVLGLSFSAVCWAGTQSSVSNLSRVGRVFQKTAKKLSDISYTLYLTHMPFGILLASVFYRQAKSAPTFAGLILFLFQLSMIVLISWAFWFCFERNTQKVRDYALGVFTKKASDKDGN